jgi:Protein of unknown function (DUF3551)
MKLMLTLAGCLALALLATPGAAQTNYPWCSYFADGAGANCGLASYEQCMASVRGSGGYCEKNDMYKGPNTSGPNAAAPAQHQAHKRHSKNS